MPGLHSKSRAESPSKFARWQRHYISHCRCPSCLNIRTYIRIPLYVRGWKEVGVLVLDNTPQSDRTDDRMYWVWALQRIARPVLEAGADQQLRIKMPVEERPGSNRRLFTHLEAVGRTLSGMAPWLASSELSGEEEQLRERYAELARRTITSITHPDSPDFLNYTTGNQPLVDMAFLAQGILRAPAVLLDPLAESDRLRLAHCIKEVRRSCRPPFNNWLLFSAMIEVLLYRMGDDWDPVRVDYALRMHKEWYVGDGAYGDGPHFHWDYYNSYVIHPMLVDVLNYLGHVDLSWGEMKAIVQERQRRYASVQERLIAPDGSYPPLGRSIAYRFGAFHSLAQASLMHHLPEGLRPSQVRGALTAVLRRFFAYPEMFDESGWLRIGLYGHQPSLGEGYISTGSLYLFTTGFIPLGLGPNDEFWNGSIDVWTQCRLQLGEDLHCDHALD